jgi:hypothetical protein
MVVNQRGTQIARRQGRMNTYRQAPAFTPGACLEARDHDPGVVDKAPGGFKEFLTRHGGPRSAIGAFEQYCTELMFKTTEAAAQRRLANVQGIRSLPQAPVLRHNNCPPHVLKFDSHRLSPADPISPVLSSRPAATP